MIPSLADLIKIWADGTKQYDVKLTGLPTIRCKYCYTFLGFIYPDYVELDLTTKIPAADPEFFEKIDTHLNCRYHCEHINTSRRI